MNKQMQADFRDQKVRFMDSDVNHIADITTAGGVYDLLRTTNDKIVGQSDFDSNKLEAGVNVAVEKIKIGYGKAVAADNTPIKDIVFSSLAGAMPEALKRAKLIIKQDNKTLLKLPVERFTQGAVSTKTQGEEDALELGTPLVLIEQKPIDIQIEFGQGADIVAGLDKHYLQVRLMGTETAAK
ncbi:hypothetical protein KDU71_02520 [Carboxylicivirga sediminis]|uniref:Uncharacterized protein n=1 Tax=Carboxylicivirga sediminis TaxID=2006564 RepID=A0A941IWH7_9BACT|nr:hypothetical protein [Carboxylicivirga sediminis]MBR8534419.1 hypothetical protein [Carboxylicivirga sediminis]